MSDLFVIAGIRTPFIRMGTDFDGLTAADLGREACSALLTRTGIDPGKLSEVIFGCVAQPYDSANVARIIGLRSGVPAHVPAATVHRNCASGFEAVTTAHQRLAAGMGDLFLVGGAESMSQVPLFYPHATATKFGMLAKAKGAGAKLKAMSAFRPRDFKPVIGLQAGLTDPYSGMIMGDTAELLAREHGISRYVQDAFAAESHRKALAARESLNKEIAPVYINGKAIVQDNGLRDDSTVEKLGTLKPIFDRQTGSVTAGNSSQITDGAVALLVGSEAAAHRIGLEPVGRLMTYAYAGCDPARMGLGPVHAIALAKQRTGLSPADADVIEINEAFAAQVLAVLEKLHHYGDHDAIDVSRINRWGGSIALGHPVGATGARLVLTALHQLHENGGKRLSSASASVEARELLFGSNEPETMSNIILTIKDGIATITFDREGAAANLFDGPTLEELGVIIGRIAADVSVKGVLLRSAKPSIFIAGADLNVLSKAKGEELEKLISLGQETFSRLEDLQVPTVAAIHGACVGGGLELALACDWRIASDSKKTKIGLPETQLGILPAWGGSTRLPKLIGLPTALSLILGGKLLAAKAAKHKGVVDAVVPEENLEAFALTWISKGKRDEEKRWLMHNPVSVGVIRRRAKVTLDAKTGGHYPGPSEALEVVTQSVLRTRSLSLAAEREAILRLSERPETAQLIRLFFLQEKAKKHRHVSAEPRKIDRVAVIGAGVMGSGITYWVSTRGFPVLMKDVMPEAIAKGMKGIRKLYQEAVVRRVLTQTEGDRGLDRIHVSAEPVPMGRFDLVIEAAVEELSIKKKIFADLSSRVSPETLLATNTSALPVHELAGVISNPERLLGLHFFNPVHRMQLVEVVRTPSTSNETLATGVAFVRAIGKLPVVVKDSPGFLVNRILMPYLVEAAALFEKGGDPQVIDRAMLDFGMPMGPLRLLDEVGLDVAVHVAKTLSAAFPDRMRIPEIAAKLAEKGQLGRKSGKGFYCHEGSRNSPNPDALELRSGKDPAPGDVRERLAALMTDEARRCLDEGIAESADDIDLAMVMGTGYAPFRGGPMQYGKEKS